MRWRLGNSNVLPTSKKMTLSFEFIVVLLPILKLTGGRFRAGKSAGSIKLKNRRCIKWNRSHGPTARCRPVAPAPAVLQRPGDGAVSPALDAPPCFERLLRDGEAAGRVPTGASDVQSGALADHADSGLCFGRASAPFSAGCEQAREGTDAGGAAVCAAIFVSSESGEYNRALSAVPRAVGEISRGGGIARASGKIFSGSGSHRLAGALADCMGRRVFSGGKRRCGTDPQRPELYARRPAVCDRAGARTARPGSAGACGGGKERHDRDFDFAFLSSHSAAGVRHADGGGFLAGAGLAAEPLSPSRGRSRAIAARTGSARKSVWGAAARGVAVGGQRLRRGGGDCTPAWSAVDGDRRRRAGTESGDKFLTRRLWSSEFRSGAPAVHDLSLRECQYTDESALPRPHALRPDRIRIFGNAAARGCQ